MRIKLYNEKYSNDILAKSKTTYIPGYEWQDIAQELEIILWKNLRKFKGINQASERTFALKIMKNKILDLAKTSNRQKRFLDSHHLIFSELQNTEFGQALLDSAIPILGDNFYE